MTQFIDHHFTDLYDPTVENSYEKTVKVDGQMFRLELIDAAGQDEFSELPQNICMNVDGWILVYSISSMKSFEVVRNLYEQLEDKLGGMKKFPVVLVGNKTDLDENRVVERENGAEMSRQWNAVFMESSAKQNKNVFEIFASAVRQCSFVDSPKQKKRIHYCLCS